MSDTQLVEPDTNVLGWRYGSYNIMLDEKLVSMFHCFVLDSLFMDAYNRDIPPTYTYMSRHMEMLFMNKYSVGIN